MPTRELIGIFDLPSSARLARSIIVALLLAAGASPSSARGSAPLAAGRISADTPESLRIRGSDAIAGIGDWYLSNGFLCAAVSDNEHSGQLIPRGGTLVDLGHCGRDDDQFLGIEPLFNFDRSELLRVREIEGRTDTLRAEIVARAREVGLEMTTRYILDLEHPDRLRIHTRIRREADGPRLFAVADTLLHAESALRNFVLNDGGAYSGFRHVSRERSDYLEIASAIRTAAGTVLVGSDGQGPPISYLYRPLQNEVVNDRYEAAALDSFTLAFSSVTVTNIGTQPLWFPANQPGLAQAFQFLWMDLPIGHEVIFERELRVSPRADVAAHSDAIYSRSRSPADPIRVTGTLDDPDARIHVHRAGDGATSHLTMARPDRAGRFSFVIPRGSHRLEILARGGRRVNRDLELRDATERVDLGSIPLSRLARIVLPRGKPMRLVFRGLGDTPDPVFGDDSSGLTLGGRAKPNSQHTRDVHRSGADSDPIDVEIAPGDYRILATRGPEYSLTQATLSVAAGDYLALEIENPVRLFETEGWIGADFHVHAAPSFDSTLPQVERLRSFVAEGGEVLVATDHDVVSEYASLIETLGIGHQLTSVSGLELTSNSPTPDNPFTSGHINLFPLPYRPERNRAGAIQDEGLRLREIIARARALPGSPIVQLSHPRRPDKELHHGAFFDHLSVAGHPFDPGIPLESDTNRSLLDPDPETGLRDVDFDAIELMNGQHPDRYRLVQRDWFSLLSQGHRIAGFANSDTHNLANIVSVPRNYVRVAQDKVEGLDLQAFLASAREGHVCGTSGPLLHATLGGAGPGDSVRTSAATLRVDVRAAPWIPVSRLRIYRDGWLSREVAIEGSGTETFDLEFERDGYVVVEVEGNPGPDYAEVLPNFTPLAYCNPIYVDADGDGDWTPPGLPPH